MHMNNKTVSQSHQGHCIVKLNVFLSSLQTFPFSLPLVSSLSPESHFLFLAGLKLAM